MQTAGIMHVCLRLHLTSHHQRQRRRLQVGSQTTALPSRLAGCWADSAALLLLLLNIGTLLGRLCSTLCFYYFYSSILAYWYKLSRLGCRLFLLYSLNVLLPLKICMLGRLCSTGLFLRYCLLLLLLLLKIGTLLQAEQTLLYSLPLFYLPLKTVALLPA